MKIEDYCAKPLAKAVWQGEGDVLPKGVSVDVLAVDQAGRFSRHFGTDCGVPARTACWIRYWSDTADYAKFRSCDLADLELSEEDFDKLLAL
jgi:hypothetical protein